MAKCHGSKEQANRGRWACSNVDKYVFVKDTEFSSPSSAAAVIHGGSANGLTAWVNANGKSLKDLQNV